MGFFVFALFFAVLAGCSSGPSIDTSYTATGQGSRVQYIVLHYTAADLPRSLQLLTQTDVLVTNVRLKGLERGGLDYNTLKAEYPALIFAHLSAWGLTGPRQDDPGYDVGAFFAYT